MATTIPPSTANGTSTKPSILIIGGLGFIGRHLAHHIHTHSLSSHYRLVDKVLPQLAHLSPEHTPPCSPPYFLQADASNPASHPRIFAPPPSIPPDTDFKWDYIINLGGETAWSQSPEVYAARTTHLSLTLGLEAARRGCRAFVEASTAIVYKPSRNDPATETSPLKPWLPLAKAKLDAEAGLSRIEGLKDSLVMLRLAHVYGEYDVGFMSKFLCLARVYQELGRELKWLWTEELRVHSVWVGDVVAAIMRVAEWRVGHPGGMVLEGGEVNREKGGRRPTLLSRVSSKSASGSSPSEEDMPLAGTPIFNIVDHGDTCQGTLARLAAEVFGIKTGFQGSLISQFAKLNLESVVDDLNDEILGPWAEMLERKGLTRGSGRLSPFLETELLGDKDLCVRGELFERVVGFQYQREGLDVRGIREMIESYGRMGWWP